MMEEVSPHETSSKDEAVKNVRIENLKKARKVLQEKKQETIEPIRLVPVVSMVDQQKPSLKRKQDELSTNEFTPMEDEAPKKSKKQKAEDNGVDMQLENDFTYSLSSRVYSGVHKCLPMCGKIAVALVLYFITCAAKTYTPSMKSKTNQSPEEQISSFTSDQYMYMRR